MRNIDQQFCLAIHSWIKKDNKYLITHRSDNDDFMPGCWDTPGGGIDFGENHQHALIREVKEESGLDVKINKLIFCHDILYPNRHWFVLVYECEIIGDSTVTIDPNEHDEYRWMTIEELKDLPKLNFLEDFYINYLTQK